MDTFEAYYPLDNMEGYKPSLILFEKILTDDEKFAERMKFVLNKLGSELVENQIITIANSKYEIIGSSEGRRTRTFNVRAGPWSRVRDNSKKWESRMALNLDLGRDKPEMKVFFLNGMGFKKGSKQYKRRNLEREVSAIYLETNVNNIPDWPTDYSKWEGWAIQWTWS